MFLSKKITKLSFYYHSYILYSLISKSRFRVGELATLKRKSSLLPRRLAVPIPAAEDEECFEADAIDFTDDACLTSAFAPAVLPPDVGGGSSSVGASSEGGSFEILP